MFLVGNCFHKCLLEGDLHTRFNDKEKKLLLLDFLSSEVMAKRLITTTDKSSNSFLAEVGYKKF